jgi:two-component system, cell cycle sensor histidine kinase and response regulator CckA
MKAPLPANEATRVKALHQYEILDTGPEQEFDDITLLASNICKTPIAMVSLIDENRQWFKSKVGTTINETPRDIAFCAHGILQSEVLVVKDTHTDERFASSPLVTGHAKIRFYAGSPLVTADGHALGMLCVKDQVPRELSEEQKAALQALSRQVVAQLELRRSVAKLKQTEKELSWKTAFFEAQVNSSIDGILVVNDHGKQILQNQRFNDLWKIPAHIAEAKDDAKQVEYAASKMKDPKSFADKVAYLYSHPNEISRDEIELIDGTVLDRYSSPVTGKDGKHYGRIWVFRDITERKRVEGHLYQSQKLETVGKLAGGVAHEFNSIMTAIIGHSELMLQDLPAENPLTENAAEIHKAADRAAGLTRQLLAFGRKQLLAVETLDLNSVLAGMKNTLLHLMGRSVEVRFSFAAGLKPVKADAGQIEQVIMNIVMNAADAMPNGGKLTLETAKVTLDAEYAKSFPELKAGDFVMLAIGDTGAGMSEEVKRRAFEPFFTTKDVGKGTGLGLATCHGIVKQSGGHIAVYSEPGRGTTFKIYLPQIEEGMERPVQTKAPADLPRGVETVLLVEDDPALREMAVTLLKRLGYTVLAAADGVEAMTLVHRPGTGHIDLLFTDVVMPNMSGRELADRMSALRPQTKILFTSAYTESGVVHQGVLDPNIKLLHKPFTPSALAHKIREILNAAIPI